MRILPVLLSGGVGSRLWPLSRAGTPKQLQQVYGDVSMIQATAQRLAGMEGVEAPIVVCGERHAEMTRSQLEAIGSGPAMVIAEPAGRNTAPAVMLAALAAPDDAMLLVLPADHVVADVERFQTAVLAARPAVAAGSLVTFGVVPTTPETGYGYIRAERSDNAIQRVAAFVEKPDLPTARGYLESGLYLWNSGIFAFRADIVRAEIARLAPDVSQSVTESLVGRWDSDPVHPGDRFHDAPSVSFDNAVMEHTDLAVVIRLDAGWSDVGSWASLWDIEDKDESGNVIRGDAIVMDSTGVYVRSDRRLVTVLGLDDVVVVETGDAILVAARDRVQDVKALVERLHGRPELDGLTGE